MSRFDFKFYSVLKNEDAPAYTGENVLVAADGLGGSGSTVHYINRENHPDMHGEIFGCAFGDLENPTEDILKYFEELIAPMADGKEDTSALWASRIVIGRCVYALTCGEFKNADLSSLEERARLVDFISAGLNNTAGHFGLKKGRYDGQLLLPTTLAFIRFYETEEDVVAETVWAGDSRCYAITPQGLKLLSVDDEDASGSITNLFYAGNEKTTLNYLCRKIKKPCALMAVSDGVFDPFDPHDHLGVEHTFLKNIRESQTAEELAQNLKVFYDGVHGDDATAAFVSFGFENFGELKAALSARTDEIISVCEKRAEMYSALEVTNQTEEEASHYVSSRTRDRYDYVISSLLNTLEAGGEDIALIPEIVSVCKEAGEKYEEYATARRVQKREEGLRRLYNAVCANPGAAYKLFTPERVDFGADDELKYAFISVRSNSRRYAETADLEELNANRRALYAKRENLHLKIKARLNSVRNRFDLMWGNDDGQQARANLKNCLEIWQSLDYFLQYFKKAPPTTLLPQEDFPLASEVFVCVREIIDVTKKLELKNVQREESLKKFKENIEVVFARLKNMPQLIQILLTGQAVGDFGLDDIKAHPGADGKKEAVLRELNDKKEEISAKIVRALAENYQKTSVLDGQYNATKLNLFRTYFKLKASGDGGVKDFEARLAALEEQYESLVK